MSALHVLAREHRLFERLIEGLRDGAEFQPQAGRERIARTLRLLLPALERHDRIEDLVFGKPDAAWEKDEKLAHELVEAQHAALKDLRVGIQAVLSSEREASFPRLKGLAELLADKLQWHFKTEELLLWPLHLKRRSRSIDRSVEREAERSVRELVATVSELSLANARRGPA